MKPTSVIFLIFSIILVAAGILTCKYARGEAEESGVELFGMEASESGDALVFDLSEEDLARIVIKAKGADITIHGDAEKNMVELHGFSEHACDVTVANKTLTIDNTVSIASLLNIASSGVSFNGFRHYINRPIFEDEDIIRTIDIYVTKKAPVTKYTIELEGGDIELLDLRTKSDYEIELAGAGDLSIINVRTASDITASVDQGNIVMKDVIFGTSDFDISKGDFEFTYLDKTARSYVLYSEKGEIINEDDDNGGLGVIYITSSATLDVSVIDGNIRILKPDTEE